MLYFLADQSLFNLTQKVKETSEQNIHRMDEQGGLDIFGAVRTKPLLFPRQNMSSKIGQLVLLPGEKQLIVFQRFMEEQIAVH